MGVLSRRLNEVSLMLASNGLLLGLAASVLKNVVPSDKDREVCRKVAELGKELNKTAEMLHLLSHVREVELQDVLDWTAVTLAVGQASADGQLEPGELLIAKAIKEAVDKLNAEQLIGGWLPKRH